MPEFETPPELATHRLSEAARWELNRILAKTQPLLELAATHLAMARQGATRSKELIQVEVGDVIRAAEVLFVPEQERALPWLNELLEDIPYHSCFISYSTKDR